MLEIVALPSRAIELGRLGENEHRQVSFDVSEYLTMYPSASFTLLHKLPGASVAYPVVSTAVQDGKLLWTVTNADLAAQGLGQCELLVMEGNVIAKSVIYQTHILPALDGSGDVPDPWESWQEVFAGLKDDAEQAAEDAEAASQAVQDMTVSAQTKVPGTPASAIKSVDPETGAVSILFGIPQGAQGSRGATGQTGPAGADGADGVSPTVSVTDITGGHRVSITDVSGTYTFDVMDGEQGETGPAGADGYSPTATVTKSGSTATITITDKSGTTTATVSDGTDGTPGVGVPSGGTDGQMLVKDGSTDYATKWANAPTAPVTDVQVNGTSVVSSGVANVPMASANALGVVKPSNGVGVNSEGKIILANPTDGEYKSSGTSIKAVTPSKQHMSTFYGLAKAAGDSTQPSSSNAVGTYTDAAKGAIQHMFGTSDLIGIVCPGTTATANITSGQYVIWQGGLYKATTNISSGDTLSSSNLIAVDGGGLNALAQAIADLNKPYRLIKEITITDTTGSKVYIDADANGAAFSLTDVVFHITGLVSSGNGNGGIVVNNGNTTTDWNTKGSLAIAGICNSTAQTRIANLSVVGGRFFGCAETANASTSTLAYNLGRGVAASGIYECNPITNMLLFSTNGFNFTAGNIKVYGR